ncbi:MAG: hypothetical protein ACRCYQ_09755 [Nocardioides sp.]
MKPIPRYAVPAALLVTLCALAACAGEPLEPSEPRSPAASAKPSGPTGKAEPTTDSDPRETPLEWEPVTSNGDLVAGESGTLSQSGGTDVVLSWAGTQRRWSSSGGQRISVLLMDEKYAAAVAQDPQEERSGSAHVFALSGDAPELTVDEKSDLPTTNGGTWTLGEGSLFHATYQKRRYCLVEVDLAAGESAITWCAPANSGFNDARITPAGLTVLSFELGKDGCRTPVVIEDGQATPLDGPTACIGWDSLQTPDGAIWSEIGDPNRIEEATFYAAAPRPRTKLAVGDSGSLVWCGGAAYFTQQTDTDGDPARLMRWRASDGLTTVYETPGSPGFISRPRCGGSKITITAKSEGGDEQVSAAVSG